MKRRGITLMELLTVLVIIALLIALLLPVVTSARRRAQMAPCISNLKQIYLAWSLYKEENNEQWPTALAQIVSRANKDIFRCPLDKYGGVNRWESHKAKVPVSYRYISPHPEFRRDLSEKDPNHGIAVCILHGEIKNPQAVQQDFSMVDVFTEGKTLRLRLDGSVQQVNIPLACFKNPSSRTSSGILRGRPDWILMTDIRPCPSPWCPLQEVPCPQHFP